jgi:predicted AAA+ superfamily ATPase
VFEILPLTFSEFLELQGVQYATREIDFDQIGDARFDNIAYETLKSYYEKYIEYGGYPAVVSSDSNMRKSQLLEEIFSSYINLDVRLLADFKSISNLQRIISLVGARVGSRLNVDDLSKITGLSRPTVTSYLTFLEQTYLIRMVPAFSASKDVKVRLPKKPYFIDNGIARINADLSGGAKFENMICHQLGFYGNLSFYDSKEGEIDFVLERSGVRYAFEIKETPTDNHLRKLQKLTNKLHLPNAALVGRHSVAKFQNYIWGGEL